jgi:very-short-patch-repair endonuclease
MAHYTFRRRMTIAARELRQHQTPEEAALWERLRNRKCGGFKFRRQYVIDRMIVDFYCHECRLVVEVYGTVHADKNAQAHDEARLHHLHSLGYASMVVYNSDIVCDVEAVLRTIERRCFDIQSALTA